MGSIRHFGWKSWQSDPHLVPLMPGDLGATARVGFSWPRGGSCKENKTRATLQTQGVDFTSMAQWLLTPLRSFGEDSLPIVLSSSNFCRFFRTWQSTLVHLWFLSVELSCHTACCQQSNKSLNHTIHKKNSTHLEKCQKNKKNKADSACGCSSPLQLDKLPLASHLSVPSCR